MSTRDGNIKVKFSGDVTWGLALPWRRSSTPEFEWNRAHAG